jgi:hypothetical protein
MGHETSYSPYLGCSVDYYFGDDGSIVSRILSAEVSSVVILMKPVTSLSIFLRKVYFSLYAWHWGEDCVCRVRKAAMRSPQYTRPHEPLDHEYQQVSSRNYAPIQGLEPDRIRIEAKQSEGGP